MTGTLWGCLLQYSQCLAHKRHLYQTKKHMTLFIWGWSWAGREQTRNIYLVLLGLVPYVLQCTCCLIDKLDPIYMGDFHAPNQDNSLRRATLRTIGASLDGCGASALESPIFLSGTLSGLLPYFTLTLSQNPQYLDRCSLFFFFIANEPRLFCLPSPGPEWESHAVLPRMVKTQSLGTFGEEVKVASGWAAFPFQQPSPFNASSPSQNSLELPIHLHLSPHLQHNSPINVNFKSSGPLLNWKVLPLIDPGPTPIFGMSGLCGRHISHKPLAMVISSVQWSERVWGSQTSFQLWHPEIVKHSWKLAEQGDELLAKDMDIFSLISA